jgi:hypothetical protein
MWGRGPTLYKHNYNTGLSLVSLALWEEGEKEKNRNLVPVHKRQGV